ncbi:hypothetical protein [Roseimaritima ulvae]|uniref:Uncharacterized protein n=1 Tax=Roseimaritima ulvae TaxID=980254 RepID=A0A5B9QS77_9BACT|nr:hypothetical protein [Roseimaritima ulvae]QEG40225.1 hypothetical protein UC8_22320 [Roseimaritima ulvae]
MTIGLPLRPAKWLLIQSLTTCLLLISGLVTLAPAQSPRDETESGIRYRRIFVLENQEAKLLPSDYRPVAAEELERLLEEQRQQADQLSDSKPRLNRVLYRVRYDPQTLSLRSPQTTLDIAYSGDQPTRLDLGRVNWAIAAPKLSTAEQANSAARWLTDKDGHSVVALASDTQLDVAWSLAGVELPDQSVRMKLQIPPCARSQMFINLPEAMRLSIDRGVLRELASPPPEAGMTTVDTPLRWYRLELGGLDEVELTVVKIAPPNDQPPLVVRRQSMSYQASAESTLWTAQLTIEATPGGVLPPFTLNQGRTTSIQMKNKPVRWKEVVEEDRVTVHLTSPVPGPRSNVAIPVELTLQGVVQNVAGQPFELPWPQFVGRHRITTTPLVQAQIRTTPSIKITELVAPPQWRLRPTLISEDGARTMIMEGAIGNDFHPPAIQLQGEPDATSAQTSLRLAVEDRVIAARWNASLAVGEKRDPIRIEFERNWRIDSLQIADSGRVIELPSNQRFVTIWPEETDVQAGTLQLRASGERLMRFVDGNNARTIHATWFARLKDCRTQSVAAVLPPQSYRWAAGTVLRGPLMQPSELSPPMLEMLGPLGDGALLFRLENDTTPMLELVRPLPEIDADMRLDVSSDGNEITEVLTFSCKSPSAVASQLLVRCGQRHQRPPFTWSLAEGSAAGWTLPQLQSPDEGQEETWLVTLPAEQRGTLQLTARRHYRVEPSQTIDLPSIAQVPSDENAASISVNQTLVATVAASLHIDQTNGPVQRVPSSQPDAAAQRLRYQPNLPSSIVVTEALSDLVPAVLWEENVDVIASVRWGDSITARYQSDGRQPLQIKHAATLRLIEARLNDQSLDVDAVQSAAGMITIPATGTASQIVLQFDQTAMSSGFVRKWNPPELAVSGVILKKTWRLWPAVDTVAPHFQPWLPLTMAEPGSASRIPILYSSHEDFSDGSRAQWLISAELAWAGAAIVSLLVFAFSWWTARYSATLVLLGVLLCMTWALGSPAWFWVIGGFLVTPAIAAALLSVALQNRKEPYLEPTSSSSDLDFSYARTSVSLFLAWLVLAAGPGHLQGQDPVADNEPTAAASEASANGAGQSNRSAPFSILIPITEEGELAGTHVYVPEQLYGQLFRRTANAAPQAPTLLRRADYRVRISSLTTRASLAKLEARIELETDSIKRPIRLPFPAESVREVDVLADGVGRSIRWLTQENTVSLQLPKPGKTTLRLTLDVPITVDDYGIYSIDFPIPRIGSSTLAFDADTMVDTLAAPTCLGASTVDMMMGDLSAELGPTETLALRWRPVQSNTESVSPPLVRRFLIQATTEQIVGECLMDVSAIINDRGEEVLLDLGSSGTPVILSPSWSVVPELDGSEPQAGRMRLRCSNPKIPPIRLAWETPTAGLPQHAADPALREYTLPAVQIVGATPLGPTFIALNKPPTQTFRMDDTGLVVPMSIERFLGGWNSNVDVIEQAVVAEGQLPKLLVATAPPQPWQCEQIQQLLVRSDDISSPPQLILDYQATVRPGDGASPPMQLAVPNNMRIHQITVAGKDVSASLRRQGGLTRIPLPEWSSADVHQVHLRGSLDVPANGRFAPPLVRLEGVYCADGWYSMARGSNVAVQQIEETPLPPSTPPIATSERLAKSVVPLWGWQLTEEDFTSRPGRLPGQYEVTHNVAETATVQRTELSFESGRWTMETIIHLRPIRGRIDFLTVEIPSRWSEDLTVSSAESWSGQPAADPAKRLIRILPADSTKARHEIRIRSRLVGGDLSQVSVPEVRVLGDGTRRLFVSVPQQIEQTAVEWETTGTRRGPRPDEPVDFLVPREGYQQFEVGGAWSVTMVATTQTPQAAAASTLDVQVFAQPDRPALIICRWDLFPAERSAVQLRLPPQFEVLGQWSAGVPVPLTKPDDAQDHTVTLPLNLSQLAQPVVVLGQVQVADLQRVALPEMLDIPVTETWLTRYDSENSARAHSSAPPWTAATQTQRYEALTESVMVSLERSRDSLANRPTEEVSAWIAPWVSRFPKLNPTSALAVADEVETAADAEDNDATEASAEDPESEAKVTTAEPSPLEVRLTEYLDSVLGTADWAPDDGDAAPLVPAGWTVAQTQRKEHAASFLPAAFVTDTTYPYKQLETLGVGVAVSVLLIILVGYNWSRLARWVQAPAFWLFLMGLVGFAFAPLPVAIALCFVAISSRTLRKTTPKHP